MPADVPAQGSRSSGSTASSTGLRRVDRDAIRYPLRYPDPADREIVALLAACMAYGRVDLFGPWIEWVLARMGESPARFVLGFDPAEARAASSTGFHYRFNRAARRRWPSASPPSAS